MAEFGDVWVLHLIISEADTEDSETMEHKSLRPRVLKTTPSHHCVNPTEVLGAPETCGKSSCDCLKIRFQV